MITQEQRELRRKYIGSSDAAAIMGLDPYRSAADVWLEKTGRAEDFGGNDATDRGVRLEPVLIQWAEEKLSGAFLRDRMALHPSLMLAANLDAYQPRVHNGGGEGPGLGGVNDEPFVVEAKTSVLADEWGQEGTDEVPDRVLIQTHHQMVVLGEEFRVAYVPVLLPGFRSLDFRLYRVRRNDDLAKAVEAAGMEFMEKFVRPDNAPDDYRPSMDVLKRVRREPNKSVIIPDVAVSLWQQAKARAKVVEEELERATADLIACMGDADGATCSLGALTYMETTRNGYEVKPTTFRTLRFKKTKESK